MKDTVPPRPYIYRGNTRKYLYEHLCYCCESVFLSTMKRKIYFCPTCQKDKRRIYAASQVMHNIHRAEKAELPATLTVQQWLAILDHFSWLCAYCQTRPYSFLEHFIPINQGGGTTPDNVLPSCRSCNSLKYDKHPSMIPTTNSIYHALQTVQHYLETRRSEEVAL